MNHFHLYEQRGHVSIFCSQHLMQVMNCGVGWNVHGGLSLCQWRKLLCIYALLNTWCTWLTVMDRTLCVGCSTDGTTLCCRPVSNSWQSTLKNIHVVNTYLWFPLWYDISIQHICESDFVTDNTHDYSAWFQLYKKVQKITWQMTSKMYFCVVCTSTWCTNLTKISHKKSHQTCILLYV